VPPAFPKAATPSFSFSPAPAAAVMPPTSCQPVFSFSSSSSKPTATVFSFPDIPVTPAAFVPAALGVAVTAEDSSSATEEPSPDRAAAAAEAPVSTTNPMDAPLAAAQQTTATFESGDRPGGVALIDEGKAFLSAGNDAAALSCFEKALVAFGGNRPKLEQRIAALKKTMGIDTAESPTHAEVEHDTHNFDKPGDESTSQLGRLKDWVRSTSVTVLSSSPTRN